MKNNTIVPQNFKENLQRGTQIDLTVQTRYASLSSRDAASSSVSASNKASVRRRNSDRPYPCTTCGIEFKSRILLHKHCRSVNHGVKSGNYNSQLQNEDGELDISQSTSSDLELSSCSTTTNSDAISRSTTPPEEAQSTSFGTHSSALNYSTTSQGLSVGGHSIASLTAPDRPYKPKFHKAVYYQSNANINNSTNSISQGDDSKPRALIKSKQVDVISENATFSSHPLLSTPSVEYLKEHISKIISQNEAIMEGVEPALQKKYHKITGIPRGTNPNVNNAIEIQIQPHTSAMTPLKKSSDDVQLKNADYPDANSINPLKKPFPTLQQQAQKALNKSHPTTALNLSADSQPLNLTNTSIEAHRKKSIGNDSMHRSSPVPSTSNPSEASVTAQSTPYENHHPQNPERSIIKSLLLNSRGLAVPTAGEGEDAVYTCPLCNISFRSADNLQYHTKSYCQGTPQVSLPLPAQANGSPHSAPSSPVGSPSHKYFRSNSFNLYRPDTKYSPKTLAKLAAASSNASLRHHRTPLSLAKLAYQQAAGYLLNKPSSSASSSHLPYAGGVGVPSSSRSGLDNFKASTSNSSTPPSAFIASSETQSVSSQCVQITKQLMDASLPSPGPLLGKTRLVDHYNAPRALNKVKEAAANLSKPEVIVTPTESALTLVDVSKHTSTKDPANVAASDEPFTPRKLLQMCGGEVTIVEKIEEKVPRFGSSGGSIVSISTSPDTMPENSPLSIRSGLLSGGSIIEALPVKRKSSTTSVSGSPAPAQQILPNLSRLNNNQGLLANYFQFPTPINSITAYNPLTLPPKQPEFSADLPAAIEATKIMHGGKIIPFVPGIPGPNSLSANAPLSPIIPTIPAEKCSERIYSPSRSANLYGSNTTLTPSQYILISLPIAISNSVHAPKRSNSPESPPMISKSKPQMSSQSNDGSSSSSHLHSSCMPPHHMWTQSQNRETSQTEKSFNFMRIAENLSPPKTRFESAKGHGSLEVSTTNLDKLKPRPKPLIQVPEVVPLHINIETVATESSALTCRSAVESTVDKIKVPVNIELEKNTIMPTKPPPKFLRPCSLALKPGTFTPKRHHGITPTANTLPLISPETPRPSKHCVQLYLNGHAYTYLGLKCSTKTFYCTVNRPQPVYAVFAGRPELSMYSNWQTCAENNPHPLGFSPKEVMSLYDSRQRTHNNYQGSKFTTSNKMTLSCASSDKSRHANQVRDSKEDTKPIMEESICISNDSSDTARQNLLTVPGGYKSNEDYTYVRGRGRGRYVCLECGMRCIKPCTLKKHIRTVHSDVRPFTCRLCMFSFKTKGNLTKHMESKAHYKKFVEKDINPNTSNEDMVNSEDDRLAMTATGTNHALPTEDGDTISDDCSDGDELEIDMESSDNEDAKLPDHEAAHCLLSLSQRSPTDEMIISPKTLVPRQPITYPYVQSDSTAPPKLQSNSSEFHQNQLDTFGKSDTVISKMGVNLSNEVSAAASKVLKDCKQQQQRRVNMNSDVIDLSKPRIATNASESRESDCKTTTSNSYAGAAELLKSLMTLSDKVPAISPPAFDLNLGPASCNGQQPNLTNNQLMQTYLTERALQKSKMKLSQVHVLNAFDEKSGHKIFKELGPSFFSMLSKKLGHIEISPKPRSVIIANQDVTRTDTKIHPETKPKQEQNVPDSIVDEDDQSMNEEIEEKIAPENAVSQSNESSEKNTVKIELHITKPSDDTLDAASSIKDNSGMETLAEIAANSVKLNASKSTDPANSQSRETSNAANTSFVRVDGSGRPSPKPTSISSEHASQKEISAKNIASEYLKLANEQDAAVDESSASSDSDAMAENESKHVRRSSMMSLGPDVLISARTVVVVEDGFKSKSANSSDLPMVALPRSTTSNNPSRTNVAFIQEDGGPCRCTMCSASFPKSHQLVLHMNIHYMNPERKFRCNSCGINFHTQGRLQKHMRSETHNSKVNMVETQGSSTSKNPRPFECSDCNRAFRIHGHLAKHLRSKIVQKLECLQKLPFGTYAMIEEARINLTDIDTTDCDNSLASLKALAEKLKVETSSPDKRKSMHDNPMDSHAAIGANNKEVASLTSDMNTDKNAGCLIKNEK